MVNPEKAVILFISERTAQRKDQGIFGKNRQNAATSAGLLAQIYAIAAGIHNFSRVADRYSLDIRAGFTGKDQILGHGIAGFALVFQLIECVALLIFINAAFYRDQFIFRDDCDSFGPAVGRLA